MAGLNGGLRLIFTAMTYRQHFLAGIAIGIFILAVCIEAVRVIYDHGWVGSFDNVLWWLGRFRWLYDYQTFIGALVALAAARWTLKAIRLQVLQSRSSTKLQLAQVERHEEERRDAKRAAARAVLPLSLSALIEQASQRSQALSIVHSQCKSGILPKDAQIPTMKAYSTDVTSAFKEMVEYSTPKERVFYSGLLVAIQVQSSRVNGLQSAHEREEAIVTKGNIESYILGEAEINARAAALFDFARGASEVVPSRITRRDVGSGLFLFGLHDIREDLTERYSLEAETVWDPLKLNRSSA